MKLTCKKQPLLDCVLTASRAVPAKSPTPALEGIYLKAENQSLQIVGYNLKKAILTSVEAEIENEGAIVLNARLLIDIIRKLPGEDLSIDVDDKYIAAITSEKAVLKIMGVTASDYPELPSIDNKSSITLKDSLLKSIIADTIFAASDNESRPIHTGALFESSEGTLTVAAVDGYRLAIRREKVSKKKSNEFKFVVPKEALSDLEKILSGTEEDVTITENKRHISFSTSEVTLISRKLEGDFLDYAAAVPQEMKYRISADKTDIIPSLERVALIIGSSQPEPIKCVFNDNVLNLSTKSSLGNADDECILDGNCEGLEIGFNHRYIIETLKAVPSDNITLNLSSGVTPCVITPADNSAKFTYMVLPVRLKAG